MQKNEWAPWRINNATTIWPMRHSIMLIQPTAKLKVGVKTSLSLWLTLLRHNRQSWCRGQLQFLVVGFYNVCLVRKPSRQIISIFAFPFLVNVHLMVSVYGNAPLCCVCVFACTNLVLPFQVKPSVDNLLLFITMPNMQISLFFKLLS